MKKMCNCFTVLFIYFPRWVGVCVCVCVCACVRFKHSPLRTVTWFNAVMFSLTVTKSTSEGPPKLFLHFYWRRCPFNLSKLIIQNIQTMLIIFIMKMEIIDHFCGQYWPFNFMLKVPSEWQPELRIALSKALPNRHCSMQWWYACFEQ